MTNLKQKLLQEGFVTQLNDNQLDFYHNKYRTTIKNPRNIPFETLVALLKTIQKLDENNINIIIDDNQSIFLRNKSDNYPTTVDNLQETLVNIYETHIRKEN
jgi:hypothetical protein